MRAAREAGRHDHSSDAATTWILAAAVIVGGGLLAVGLAGHRQISHDDAISYLAATGHQREYSLILNEQRYPAYAWAPARDWQKLWMIEDRFIYGNIARELSLYDIHPPLYFWMLHTWAVVVGVGLWTAPTLNALIQFASSIGLYRLLRTAQRPRRQAAVAVLLFVASPVFVQSTLAARPYPLLALAAVLLADVTIRLADSGQPLRLVWLLEMALVTAAGFGTHLQFAAVVAGSGTWLALRLRSDPRRLVASLLALAAGATAFVAVQPNLTTLLQRQRMQAQPFATEEVLTRLSAIPSIPNKLTLVAHTPAAHPLLGAVALLLAGGVAFVCWRPSGSRREDGGETMCWFALWVPFVAVVIPYIATISPRHALTARHLAPALPFVASWPSLVWPSGRRLRRTCLIAGAAAIAAATTVNIYSLATSSSDVPGSRSSTDCIVIDDLRRGVLPRIVWHLPEDVRIFAADRAFLRDYPHIVSETAPNTCA